MRFLWNIKFYRKERNHCRTCAGEMLSSSPVKKTLAVTRTHCHLACLCYHLTAGHGRLESHDSRLPAFGPAVCSQSRYTNVGTCKFGWQHVKDKLIRDRWRIHDMGFHHTKFGKERKPWKMLNRRLCQFLRFLRDPKIPTWARCGGHLACPHDIAAVWTQVLTLVLWMDDTVRQRSRPPVHKQDTKRHQTKIYIFTCKKWFVYK